MIGYEGFFDALRLRAWCDANTEAGPMSMADLVGRVNKDTAEASWWEVPFPSLDALHAACAVIPRTRDMTAGLESAFLGVRVGLKSVLDPLTQPLSWLLNSSLSVFMSIPWWLFVPLALVLVYFATRALRVVAFVAVGLLFLGFIDHLPYAIQTLSIIFVCTVLCIMLGVPLGIVMSRSDSFQRVMIPILDMLQTLPAFVYLIPLIFLFSITEPKLYGIAIILYAIVPVIRLTDLGIRLVDKEIVEAADAFGMTRLQKLMGVQIPLAMPNIMAGVNQTIMMSLSMVVIASLVSAPGLGVLVLRGINNLELGVGLVAGFGIVLLAVILDRVSKAAVHQMSKRT